MTTLFKQCSKCPATLFCVTGTRVIIRLCIKCGQWLYFRIERSPGGTPVFNNSIVTRVGPGPVHVVVYSMRDCKKKSGFRRTGVVLPFEPRRVYPNYPGPV
jgi:hypothetical protein